MSSKLTWYKIAESIAELNISSNGMTEVELHGKKICIALHDNKLLACTQKCPHAGGILSAGYLDAAGNIVCPLHRYKFNMQNGRNISGEGYFLKTYPVELRSDGIYISSNQQSLF